MINSKSLNDKSYEQMIAEAIAQIPLYSKEWTNYNVSDPGITILENLTAFLALQREEMDEVSDAVRGKLLALAGFHAKEGRPARVLLQTGEDNPFIGGFFQNQKLYTQQLCYELDGKKYFEHGKVNAIYYQEGNERKDYSVLTGNFGVPGGIDIWGSRPVTGTELFFRIDHLPNKGDEAIFHVKILEEFPRNPFLEQDENPFADIEWSIYTDEGYQKVFVKDCTAGFLFSGGIYIRVPDNVAWHETEQGYMIKASLKWAAYDIPPRVLQITGLLTEAMQIDTKAALLPCEGADDIQVNHFLLQEQSPFVYVKEADGAYHQYFQGAQIRGYFVEQKGSGQIHISFQTQDGYGPIAGEKNGVLVAVYSNEMLMHRHLGTIYGYDKQKISLPPFSKIWKERLCVMVAQQKEDTTYYYFARPENHNVNYNYNENYNKQQLCYRYIETENVIEIQNGAEFEGAEVFLAECVLYQGAEGNVLSGNDFELTFANKKYAFYQYASDYKGYDTESINEVKERFVKDLYGTTAMITGEDCEQLVRRIPGLSIHKVKATADIRKNTIRIVIKPNSREKRAGVSDLYREIVSRYLEQYRMLTTRIVVEQPVYVPIDARAVIYVEKHFAKGKEQIEETLRELLDYTTDRGNFGETISFRQIYHTIEELECVDEIYELTLTPQNPGAVKRTGLDYMLNDNCLCYPGIISVELNIRQY